MPKPVLLLAFADPTRELRLAQEQRAVRDALRDMAGIDGRSGESRWEVVERSSTTLDDLRRAFSDHRNRVVGFHYAGHASGDRLLLESAAGERADAHATGLAGFLGEYRAQLQYVFLNACSTGGQVDALLRAGIPAVIATSQAIHDDVAILLATAFYSALAGGAGLRRAFEEATSLVRARVGDTPQQAYRDIDVGDDAPAADTWPWSLTVAPGAESVEAWNLGAAIGDHALGLPPLPPADLPPSPYRRLLPFTAREARVFFGRGETIHALYDRVKDAASAPIVLVHGQSGAGKSSLVDAGLQPRLAAEFDVRYARRDPDAGLCGTLRTALGISDDDALDAAWRARSTAARPLVIILDQVEEAYTRAPNASAAAPGGDAEVMALARDLVALFGEPATRPPGKVLLAFRKEWLPEIEAPLAAARLFYAKEFLARLDEDGVVEAIVGPAGIADYRLEIVDAQKLARHMATDLLRDADSPVAPTLQVLLSKMWAEASAGGPATIAFDAALYRRMRDGAALGAFLDEQLVALGTTFPDAVASGLALDVLAFHTTPLGAAQRRDWAELARAYPHVAALDALVARCVDLSLLADVVRAGDAAGDVGPRMLSHDTLAPLVRRLYDASVRPGQRARRVLESRADEWANGAVGRPLDDTDLATAEAGRSGMRALTLDEERLVAASIARRSADAAERAAAARGAIVRRRLAWTASGLIAVLGLLFVGAGVLASRAAGRAHVAAIVTAAAAQPDPLDGVLLLAALSPGSEEPVTGLGPVLDVMNRPVPAVAIATGGAVRQIRFAADGVRLVSLVTLDSSGTDRVVRVYRADRPASAVSLARGAINAAVPGPDGRVLVGWADGRVQSLDIDGRTPPRDLFRAVAPLTGLRPFADSGWIETTTATAMRGFHRVWRADRPGTAGGPWMAGDSTAAPGTGMLYRLSIYTRLLQLDPTEQRRNLVAHDGVATADGRYLRLRAESVSVYRRNARGTGDSELVALPDRIAQHAWFAPDGTAIVTTDRDSTVRVWRADSGGVPLLLRHVSAVLDARFSPDGRRVVTVTDDGTLRVWDAHRTPARGVLSAPGWQLTQVAFGDSGRRVLALGDSLGVGPDTGRITSSAIVWNVDGSGRPTRLGTGVLAAALGPEERRVVTASGDDSVRLWRLDRPASPIAIGRIASESLSAIGFARDGRHVVVVRFDGTGMRWSIDGSDAPTVLTGPEPLTHPVISANGRWLATAGESVDTVHLLSLDHAATSRDVAFHGGVATIALSPDAAHLAAGDSTAAWLVALTDGPRSGRPVRLPIAAAFAFSPDGRSLAVASYAGPVRILDADGGATRFTLPSSGGSADAVAFSPDGTRLALGSVDGTVRIWTIDWATLLDAAHHATTACLGESARHTLLGESVGDARRAHAACTHPAQRR